MKASKRPEAMLKDPDNPLSILAIYLWARPWLSMVTLDNYDIEEASQPFIDGPPVDTRGDCSPS